MRAVAIFFLLFAAARVGRAQHQEPNLVDRLLRPNMNLQNTAQDKKIASETAVITSRGGTVGTFYLQSTRTQKSFADTRNVSTSRYDVRSGIPESRSITGPQNSNATTTASLGTSTVRDVRSAPDSHQSITGREYGDQHAFVPQGKSQKSLDRKNPPLTIDQVRELLNKNK